MSAATSDKSVFTEDRLADDDLPGASMSGIRQPRWPKDAEKKKTIQERHIGEENSAAANLEAPPSAKATKPRCRSQGRR